MKHSSIEKKLLHRLQKKPIDILYINDKEWEEVKKLYESRGSITGPIYPVLKDTPIRKCKC